VLNSLLETVTGLVVLPALFAGQAKQAAGFLISEIGGRRTKNFTSNTRPPAGVLGRKGRPGNRIFKNVFVLLQLEWDQTEAWPARVSQQSHKVAVAATGLALLLTNHLLQLPNNQQLIRKQTLAVKLQLIKQNPNWEHY